MFTPLQGVRVLDLSRYLPGPLLTRILADLGAEITKVEPPAGDALRWVPPRRDGIGVAYGGLNAGKGSVSLDLKRPEGAALLRAMAGSVDVLVESFRPGVLDRLGLSVASLREAHPSLIVCSVTGYGQAGTRAQAAGHDLNYLAIAGLLGLSGPADGPPQVPGVQLADVGGGSLPGVVAVLAALLDRERTGRGRHLDISITRGVAVFGAVTLAAHAAGAGVARGTGLLTGGVPCYRCYETADGRYMAVGALEPVFWRNLCEALDLGELAGSQYLTGAGAAPAIAALAEAFRTRTQAEWVDHLAGRDVCCDPVRTPKEALADSELGFGEAAGFVVFSTERGDATPPAPGPPRPLGADGAALAERLGLDPAPVAAALRAGALTIPEETG